MQRKSKWPRDVTEDDLVLGIPNPRRKERHAIKGSPQIAPRRKGKSSRTRARYNVGAVQGKAVTFALNAPTNVLAALMGKGPLNSVVSVTATNRRWGKVADGTSTRVVTYLINKWKVRIN